MTRTGTQENKIIGTVSFGAASGLLLGPSAPCPRVFLRHHAHALADGVP